MQMSYKVPKEKKEIKMLIKLDNDDEAALLRGMGLVGEKNKSSYIRRLIHEGKNRGNK